MDRLKHSGFYKLKLLVTPEEVKGLYRTGKAPLPPPFCILHNDEAG